MNVSLGCIRSSSRNSYKNSSKNFEISSEDLCRKVPKEIRAGVPTRTLSLSLSKFSGDSL